MPPTRQSTPKLRRGRGRGRGRATASRYFPSRPPPEQSSSETNPLKSEASTAPELEEQITLPIESKVEELSSKTLETVENVVEGGAIEASVGRDEIVKGHVVSRVVEELDGGTTKDGKRVMRRRVVKVVKKIVKKKLPKRVEGQGVLEGPSTGKDVFVVRENVGNGGSGRNGEEESHCRDGSERNVVDDGTIMGCEEKEGDMVGVEDDKEVEGIGVVEGDDKGKADEREETGELCGDVFDEEGGIMGDDEVLIQIEGKGSEVEMERGMICHGVDNGSIDSQAVMEGAGIELDRDLDGEGGLKIEGEKGNSRVVFSGEMEALERKKKRKTEIFIGRLDKDAVEEDIKKVFEEVGEIVEVTLLKNESTGKNKGYAFVRYASADDASRAVEKHRNVEICGKECSVAAVQGNDTLHLGNIDKKWKTEDVTKLLHQIGVDKIDKVTVLPDPSNSERNRGFAFLELQTCKDAQIAYKTLQKKDVLSKLKNIKVSWAEPLSEPNEEEMQKVKSVYVEYLPSSWDEGKLRAHFDKFGEIESVALAKSLLSSRRKDFAFINYTTRDAAIACIDSSNHEALSDQGSKVNLKVSLARPIDRKKPKRGPSNPVGKNALKEKPKPSQDGPSVRTKDMSVSTHNSHGYRRSSTNTELVHLLREQASWVQQPGRLSAGYPTSEYPLSIPGKKRPFAAAVGDPIYSDPRGHSQAYLRPLLDGPRGASFPYHLLQGANSMSGIAYAVQAETSGLKREDLYGGRARPNYR